MRYRPHRDQNRTPIQQSVTIEDDDYLHANTMRFVMGVVIDVLPADDNRNRSAYQATDRRGSTHECTVLVVQDGLSSVMTLRNVMIPSKSPLGLDDYEEQLPRPATALVTGEEYNSQMHNVNPYDLDGDWCVIGFIGGQFDSPFVVCWLPHPRNLFDAQTTTNGNNGDSLDQFRRYFRRINGVETVVTSEGDIILSTNMSNGSLVMGDSPTKGRFSRSVSEDVGGSVLVQVKPSQTMEISFDTPVEGIGIRNRAEPSLPQTNPPQTRPRPNSSRTNTYLYVDKEFYKSSVPQNHEFKSGSKFILQSSDDTEITVGTDLVVSVDGETSITSGGVVTLEGSEIKLGENATSKVSLADKVNELFDTLANAPITGTNDGGLSWQTKFKEKWIALLQDTGASKVKAE